MQRRGGRRAQQASAAADNDEWNAFQEWQKQKRERESQEAADAHTAEETEEEQVHTPVPEPAAKNAEPAAKKGKAAAAWSKEDSKGVGKKSSTKGKANWVAEEIAVSAGPPTPQALCVCVHAC